jgi:hypothetical protein
MRFDEDEKRFDLFIKNHFPEATKSDIEHILWGLTPFPCVKYCTLKDAINAIVEEIKKTMVSWKCDFHKAINILTEKHWDLPFYQIGMHGEGI